MYGSSTMERFSRWSSSSQARLVLAAVFAVGAVTDAALGHSTSAIASAAIAVAALASARQRRSQ
jgi:hypothetical protein